MKIIDLTHRISGATGVYPGTPPLSIEAFATMPERSYREVMIRIPSHTGTHVDAPAHGMINGSTLDSFSVSAFIGRAFTVDCREAVKERGAIPASVMDGFWALADQVEYVFFYTGHDALFHSGRFFDGWPGLEPLLAKKLADTGILAVGLDVPSVDRLNVPEAPCHNALLGAGKLIFESLNSLVQTLDGVFSVTALPLSLLNADGAPVRAVAALDGGQFAAAVHAG